MTRVTCGSQRALCFFLLSGFFLEIPPPGDAVHGQRDERQDEAENGPGVAQLLAGVRHAVPGAYEQQSYVDDAENRHAEPLREVPGEPPLLFGRQVAPEDRHDRLRRLSVDARDLRIVTLLDRCDGGSHCVAR